MMLGKCHVVSLVALVIISIYQLGTLAKNFLNEAKMDAGELLKSLRTRSGFTQQSLADAVGVSRPAIALWESGRSQPSTNRLQQLFDTLELSNEDRRAMVSAFGCQHG